MLSVNRKHVQLVKIYMPWNFEVNLITRLGVIVLFSSLCKILYKASFGSIRPTNMAAKINSFFWLANVKKIFSSETAWPNGAKLDRKHLYKILYKVLHLVPFGQQTWPLLLKIEHMVKLYLFCNNSKAVNNIRNLMG